MLLAQVMAHKRCQTPLAWVRALHVYMVPVLCTLHGVQAHLTKGMITHSVGGTELSLLQTELPSSEIPVMLTTDGSCIRRLGTTDLRT
jgi:hypothetical protein